MKLAFVELERILGRPLPASARRHRPWWGNNDRSPQAKAWLGAGRRVGGVDLPAPVFLDVLVGHIGMIKPTGR